MDVDLESFDGGAPTGELASNGFSWISSIPHPNEKGKLLREIIAD